MSQIVAIFKGISALRSLIESFISAWVAYDIRNIKRDYDKKTKEQLEILHAIDRAIEARDEQAIKHLMRQYNTIKRV